MSYNWAVISDNAEKIEKVFSIVKDELGKENIIYDKAQPYGRRVLFADGHTFSSIKPSPYMRGVRIERVWIDEDLKQNEDVRCIVYPSLLCRLSDIVWI